MSKLTIKGQATVPKPIREALGLRPGSRIKFTIQNGRCVLEKETIDDPLAKWVGFLHRPGDSDAVLGEMRGPTK
jgi:AbrB family looped-hinge helix DNA binding protein